MVILIPWMGFHRKLVGSGLADETNDVACVELMVDEFPGEEIEESRIRGRIARANIVEWFNDPCSQQIPPEAIDIARREIGIVTGGQPLCQRLAA